MHILTISPETLFQAMSDSTRLRVIRLLVMTHEETCLCELVDALLEPQYNLSRHLKILRQAGLLASQKDGRWVYYHLIRKPDYLQQLHILVRSLPDADKVFRNDLKHFKSRMKLRENGRCRVGILTEDLKAGIN